MEGLILRECARDKRPLPEAIANAPQLLPGLDLYYDAFLALSSCRSLGMAEGPIPWTAIRSFADEGGFEGEQRDDLFFHVRSLDRVYLDWRAKSAAT